MLMRGENKRENLIVRKNRERERGEKSSQKKYIKSTPPSDKQKSIQF